MAAEDFHTLYNYSLDKTDFDLQITSLKQEAELLNYIVRFTIAIFNNRDQSTTPLPGVLIAGISYSVYPSGTMATVTKGEVVMVTVDETGFEERLCEKLKQQIGCHGSRRLLTDEEVGCVKVEFAPFGNHGNSAVIVYVCPTWEVSTQLSPPSWRINGGPSRD